VLVRVNLKLYLSLVTDLPENLVPWLDDAVVLFRLLLQILDHDCNYIISNRGFGLDGLSGKKVKDSQSAGSVHRKLFQIVRDLFRPHSNIAAVSFRDCKVNTMKRGFGSSWPCWNEGRS
jgi:hypothetical protein